MRVSPHEGISVSGRLDGKKSRWQEQVSLVKCSGESTTVLNGSFKVLEIMIIIIIVHPIKTRRGRPC